MFLSKLGGKRKKDNSLAFYFDKEMQAYGIGPIPRNLKREVSALIDVETPGKKFDNAYLESFDLSVEGKKIFLSTLLMFFRCAAPVIGEAQGFRKTRLAKWRCALYFLPCEDVNASAILSADEKENTVFIILNSGLILTLLHRFCALFSVAGFFESIIDPNNKIVTATENLAAQQRLEKASDWLKMLPSKPQQIAIAQICTVMAAMSVLLHELGHFMGGHLSYLRSEMRYAHPLKEIEDSTGHEPLPFNLRRLLELDADETAGRFASAIWRQYDYPSIGPDDAQVESFYMEMVLATICLYIVFEDYSETEEYFSPVWRTQIFLENFRSDFFRYPKEMKADDPEKLRSQYQFVEWDARIISAVERAYQALGWGDGFSLARFEKETNTLLAADSHALNDLRTKLEGFMPHAWHFS